VAVKADMSKAYDRVEWDFLQHMMLKMGFNTGWVDVVMRCVTTVNYRIKVNGQATKVFSPSRVFSKATHCHPIYSSFAQRV
jgi:hypothetical protein